IADRGDYDISIEILDSTLQNAKEVMSNYDKDNEKDRFEEYLKKARKKMADARETEIDIDPLRTSLKKAVQNGQNEEYNKGITELNNFLENYEKLKEIDKKINILMGLNNRSEEYTKKLKEAKKQADEGRYDQSLDMLTELQKGSEKDGKKATYSSKEVEKKIIEAEKILKG
ncbi:MAG: hypothetical protein ACOC85_00770, partial [Thermoplasmatota archaeon]